MAATNQLQAIRKGRSPTTVCLGGFPNFAGSHMANGHPDSSSKLHLVTNFEYYMHAAAVLFVQASLGDPTSDRLICKEIQTNDILFFTGLLVYTYCLIVEGFWQSIQTYAMLTGFLTSLELQLRSFQQVANNSTETLVVQVWIISVNCLFQRH